MTTPAPTPTIPDDMAPIQAYLDAKYQTDLAAYEQGYASAVANAIQTGQTVTPGPPPAHGHLKQTDPADANSWQIQWTIEAAALAPFTPTTHPSTGIAAPGSDPTANTTALAAIQAAVNEVLTIVGAIKAGLHF